MEGTFPTRDFQALQSMMSIASDDDEEERREKDGKEKKSSDPISLSIE
jgi:hypothetical protein